MADCILEIDNLKKSFRSHWTFRSIEAVKGVSLQVLRGESFGFLGHNGAGKTTSIKCILGLIHKTSGRISLNGKELTSSAQRRIIGYLPEQPYFYDHLYVSETLDFFASLHNIRGAEKKKLVDDTLARVGLSDRAAFKVRSLSKGLQQRLGFAQAIINQPELLLLDEPFSGLDPLGRLEIRNLILDLNRTGTTVLLSSHILSDVEDICNRVSIMAKGELKKVFSLKELPELFGSGYELTIELTAQTKDLHQELIKTAKSNNTEENLADTRVSYLFADYETAQKALQLAQQQAARIISFNSATASLEEVFMDITRQSRSEN